MVKWDDNKVIIIAFVFVIGLILVGSFWKPTGKIFLGNNEFSLDVGNMVYVGNNNITLLNVGEGGSILVDVGGTREIITLGYDKLVNNLLIQNVDINYNDDINKRSAILKIVLATPISCTDSDGGLNYNLKGNVVYNNLTYYDYCTSGSNLAERYCSSGTVQTAYYNCPDWVYGMCYDGACLVNTTMTTTSTSTTTTPLSQSCIDSDGNNLNIGGYVYFDPHNATTGTYYDYCYSNNQYVQEYVCGIGLNGGYYISGGGYYCLDGCVAGACVNINSTISRGLLALYPFEISGPAVDYSGNNNTGDLFGDTRFPVLGGVFYPPFAARFDGDNDYIRVNNSLVSNLNQLSTSVWVKANSSNTNKMRIFRVSGGNILYLDRRSDEKFEVTLYNNLGVQGKVTSSVAYPDTLWHNVLLTYDGQWLRLFVGGVETGSSATLNGSIRTGTNFYIGYSGVDSWDGMVDEVAVWGRVLTNEEIQYLQSNLVR